MAKKPSPAQLKARKAAAVRLKAMAAARKASKAPKTVQKATVRRVPRKAARQKSSENAFPKTLVRRPRPPQFIKAAKGIELPQQTATDRRWF